MFFDPYRMIFVSIFASLVLSSTLLFYKFIYPKREINLLYLLILISIIPVLSILRSGTYEAGDLTLHSVFLQSFYENLEDGILIPQWAGGLCGGYGCPVFMFEYVMPYYIGSIFHFLGFSFLNSTKAVLIFAYVLSGVTMYVFAKEIVGRLGAFVAGIFYLFAPYHLVDMHFRVGIGEVVSFIFIPLIFLYAKRIIETCKVKYVILLSITIALLILSHTSTSVTVLTIALGYAVIIWYFRHRHQFSSVIKLFSAYVIGFLLTLYYWLPALLELKYTWYGIGIMDVGLDFKPFLEHIYSPAGFGFLFQGNEGEQRLIIGYPHLLVILISIYFLFKNKLKRPTLIKIQLIYFLIAFLVCLIMLISITKPLWLAVPVLKSFVIAYRMLVPIMFITSIIAGIILSQMKNKKIIALICIFTIFSTILNWGNRRMVGEDMNAYKTHWSLYTEYAEADSDLYKKLYFEKHNQIPNLVLERPQKQLEVIEGDAEYKLDSRSNILHEYLVYAKSDTYMRENTFYFPGWEVYVNNKEVPVNYRYSQKMGIMTFNVPKGLNIVSVEFNDTPIRKYTKIVSLIIMVLVIISIIKISSKFFFKPVRLLNRR